MIIMWRVSPAGWVVLESIFGGFGKIVVRRHFKNERRTVFRRPELA